MALNFKPIVLIVLDGFGAAPPSNTNAVNLAKKPFLNSLLQNYPVNLLEASGLNVGLPQGEVGNSEVGHITLGSGILKYQSLPRINRSISTGKFFKLPILHNAVAKVKKNSSKLHLIGLIGNGGVHASQEHLNALLSLVRKEKVNKQTYLHVFLDGRDTAKDTGQIFMDDLLKVMKKEKIAGIASLGGRYWGMDRNKNWDRTAKAYEAIVNGQAKIKHQDPLKAIGESYKKKIYDEELEPVVIVDKNDQPIANFADGDVVIYFNFRGDRGRQLTEAISLSNFKEFKTRKLKNLEMITFTEYKKGLPVEILFTPEEIKNPLAKIFSDLNLKQLHIAETEKYAHVTFFLNGLSEEKFAGEDRILIPSPAVASYDKKPQMAADQVTQEVLKALKQDKYDFIAINYANADMVAHTGNLKATVKAVETVDQALSKLVPEVVKKGGSVFIVADHGNSEELVNPITGEIDKEHNIYPVPFLVVNNKLVGQPNPGLAENDLSLLTPIGILSDFTPTLLKVAGLKIPREMTGRALL
jgi:2,3-bisphosphoglycerate-independent phosphoglycerate mutase